MHPAPPPAKPGYETRFETIEGTGADLQLRLLLDRQQYHDPDGAAERLGISAAQWPLFGMLWPSSRVLAHAMLTFEIAGLRVLEVGCGLGLASLVVHRRGGDVTASDCHPLAAAFLLENLRLNNLPPMKYLPGDWARANPALGRFDLIIGSDVLYDRAHPSALSHFIDRHSETAVDVLIVDPGRGNHSRFSSSMATLGYLHSERSVTALPGDGGPYKGKLHSYSRRAFAG